MTELEKSIKSAECSARFLRAHGMPFDALVIENLIAAFKRQMKGAS